MFVGLTPAREEFQNFEQDDGGEDAGDGGESSDEFYEVVDNGDGPPASKDDNDLGLD